METNHQLQVFEGVQLEFLVKEEVNVDFEGEVLFNGKQTAEILGYSDVNKAVRNHTEEEDRVLITKDKLKDEMALSLGQRGTWFLTENGTFDLIYNSKLPQAKEFKKKVRQVINQVQKTGKFDSIEENIKLIKDDKERELTLGLYSLEQALKSNPNDYALPILFQQKKLELQQYKHTKELMEVKEQLKLSEEKMEKQAEELKKEVKESKEKLDNMFVIGDRQQFNNEIKSVARATGFSINEVYGKTYNKLKDVYGIDLEARSRNAKAKIQEERIDGGKRAYSPDTLNNKAGKLVIADELSIWSELGKSLMAVKEDCLREKRVA